MIQNANINWKLVRFGVVGFASNLVLYLLYLLFISFGLGHKTAMTVLFFIGTIQTYIFNKNWTFEYHGFDKFIFTKYTLVHGLGYLTNLFGLMLFVDLLGFPPEIIQGIMIFLVAILLFMLQRYWVFRKHNPIIFP